MKNKLILIIFLLCSPWCMAHVSHDVSHTQTEYEYLALQQEITKEIKFNKIIEWYKKEADCIESISIKNKNYISVFYYFTYKQKLIGSIEMQFINNAKQYNNIIFKLCSNGSYKVLYNQDAIRMILTLLNSTNDFDYYLN